MSAQHQGYVYAMKNRAMPGIIKIGKTAKTPEERRDELSSSTSVPTPFEIVGAIWTNQMDSLEKDLHNLLKKQGLWAGKEFFTIDEATALELLARFGDAYRFKAKRYSGQKVRKNHRCPDCDQYGRVRVQASTFFSIFEPCPNSYKQ